jgi:hypothetical protein
MEQRTFSPTQAVKYGFKSFFNHFGLLIIVLAIAAIILGVLPAVLAYVFNPTLFNEFLILLKQPKPAFQNELMSLIAQHKLLFIVVAPVYYVLFCTLMAGLIRIFLDLVDNQLDGQAGLSSAKRLFSMAPYALQVTALSFCMFLLHKWDGIVWSIIKMISPSSSTPMDLIKDLSTVPAALISIAALIFTVFMVYIGLRLIFVLLSFVDEKKGIMPSFVHSWNITPGNVLKLILFFILMALVLVPLMLILIMLIALLTSNKYIIMISSTLIFICMFSVGMISLTHIYRKLSPKHISFETD